MLLKDTNVSTLLQCVSQLHSTLTWGQMESTFSGKNYILLFQSEWRIKRSMCRKMLPKTLYPKPLTIPWAHTFLAWVVPVGIEPLTLAMLMPCSTGWDGQDHFIPSLWKWSPVNMRRIDRHRGGGGGRCMRGAVCVLVEVVYLYE